MLKTLPKTKWEKNTRKNFFVAVAILIIWHSTICTNATPMQNYQDNLTQQNSVAKKLEENQSSIDSLNEETKSIQENALELQLQIDEKQAYLDILTQKISQKQEEIFIKQSGLDDAYTDYYTRVRNFEEYGTTSYWAVLFKETSLEEMLSNAYYTAETLYDEGNTLAELNTQVQALQSDKTLLEDLIAEQNHVQSELKLAQIKLYQQIEKRIEELSSLENEKDTLKNELASLRTDSAYLSNEINKASYTGDVDPKEIFQSCIIDSGMANQTPEGTSMVALALQYYGQAYVWGGANPDVGFDCSGLMYYVYSQKGYKIHRVAREQYSYDGRPIPVDGLQAGDMVFFYKAETTVIGHVGMYIGNGMFIHAANQTSGIIISSLSSNYYATNYAGARRVIE